MGKKKLQNAKESKSKVEQLTWIQAQLPRDQWNNLNERRLALKITWAEFLIPAAVGWMDKLEAKPAKGSAEAPAVTTIDNKAPEKSRASKSKSQKKAPAKVAKESKASDATTTSTEGSDIKGQGHDK